MKHQQLFDAAHERLMASDVVGGFQYLGKPLTTLFQQHEAAGTANELISIARQHPLFELAQQDPYTSRVSEVMRPAPDPLVLAWLNRQARTSLYLCSTVWSELLTGLELMPTSKRKTSLREVLSVFRGTLIETPMLMFDEQAAMFYAKLVAACQKRGVQISVGDAQIAAMALQHGMAVASRDEAPFLAAGLQVICPWSAKV